MKHRASDSLEAIAIFGNSCRLPGGSHCPSKLWDLLKSPIDLVAEIRQNRSNAVGFYHPRAEHSGVSFLLYSTMILRLISDMLDIKRDESLPPRR